MKKLISVFISVFIVNIAFGQDYIVKTADDTAFLMEKIYFPEMQVTLTIPFLTTDFNPVKRISKFSDIDSLKKLVVKEPLNADHYLNLNFIYNEFSMFKEADTARRKAIDLFMNNLGENPLDTHALNCMASIYLSEMELNLARAFYKELTVVAPEASIGWSGLAVIAMMNYDLESAVAYMDTAIIAEPDNLDNYCQMSNIIALKSIFDFNNYSDAVVDTITYKTIVNTRFIEKAMGKYPDNPAYVNIYHALHLTGLIYEIMLDNSEKISGHGDSIYFKLSPHCRTALDEISAHMSEQINGTYRNHEFPYICLMLSEFLKNNPDNAVDWFNKGIKYNERSKSMYETIIGICALARNNEPMFTFQLRLDSIHPSVHNFQMTSYFYFLDGNYEQARIWADKARLLNPQDFYTLMGLAAIAAKQNNFGISNTWANKATTYYPAHPDLVLLKGILSLFNNTPMMAKSYFDELIQLNQNFDEAESIIKRFYK